MQLVVRVLLLVFAVNIFDVVQFCLNGHCTILLRNGGW